MSGMILGKYLRFSVISTEKWGNTCKFETKSVIRTGETKRVRYTKEMIIAIDIVGEIGRDAVAVANAATNIRGTYGETVISNAPRALYAAILIVDSC